MKCNIVPLRQNWRDWELQHNKSDGYYCAQFSLPLFFFTHCFSPFLASLPFLLSLLFSLAVQASTGYTHLHTYTHNQANKDLHLLEHSAPNPLKKPIYLPLDLF